jgi:acyl carrier protein
MIANTHIPPRYWLYGRLASLTTGTVVITDTSDLGQDIGLDSLDMVELVMAAERFYNIQIPDEDAEKLMIVGDCITYLTNIVAPILTFDLTYE